MIYSGLDWSGSPGAGHGPWLVFAIIHIDEADLATLDIRLAQVRATLRLSPEFPFRHSETTPRTRHAFFDALCHVPLSSHIYLLDKRAWSAVYVTGSSGTDCICDGIIELLIRCPIEVVAGQMVYIDLPRSEGKLVQRYRTTIRQAMRRGRHPAFRDMKPRPDNRHDGNVIQVADMLAGEVREHSGIAGPYLPALRSLVTIV